MSLTKLSLGGNNLYMTSLFPPRESLVSDNPAGDGNIEKLFLRCCLSFLSLPVCRRSSLLTGKGGERGAKLNDHKKAWPSINHSIGTCAFFLILLLMMVVFSQWSKFLNSLFLLIKIPIGKAQNN
jgi:hypothetical protein